MSGFRCQFCKGSLTKVHYPKLYNMAHLLPLNVFTASKGSNNYIFFLVHRPNYHCSSCIPVILQNCLHHRLMQHYTICDKIECGGWKPYRFGVNLQKDNRDVAVGCSQIYLASNHCILFCYMSCDVASTCSVRSRGIYDVD